MELSDWIREVQRLCPDIKFVPADLDWLEILHFDKDKVPWQVERMISDPEVLADLRGEIIPPRDGYYFVVQHMVGGWGKVERHNLSQRRYDTHKEALSAGIQHLSQHIDTYNGVKVIQYYNGKPIG